MKNYYATLGVTHTATPDEIKRAYRRLASQHHPDKGGDTTKFQEIEEAYRTLSDPQKRQAHDNPTPFGPRGPQNGSFDFDSIFNTFGAQFNVNNGGRQRPMMSHLRMSLWITLADAVRGGLQTISIGTQQGTIAAEITIPPGVGDGDTVQYSNLGPNGMDLVITFKIHPNPRWERQGNNLLTEQAVSIWDCILGGETEVRDVLNNTLTILIPKMIQPGTTLRLKGKGITQSGISGDMLIKIQARLPDNIDSELLENIEKFRKN
jgi:DnaJ-class molecular chaperone